MSIKPKGAVAVSFQAKLLWHIFSSLVESPLKIMKVSSQAEV